MLIWRLPWSFMVGALLRDWDGERSMVVVHVVSERCISFRK